MGDAKIRDERVDKFLKQFDQPPQGPQVQVNLKILGADFTIMALFDLGIFMLSGLGDMCDNLKKADAAKALRSARDHLNKSKMDLFAQATAEAEKLAPKVEVASSLSEVKPL